MALNHMKNKMLKSIIREMQIKPTLNLHTFLSSIKLVKINQQTTHLVVQTMEKQAII